MKADIVAVSVAFGDLEEARAVGAALVEERLAACTQIHPIESVYRWQGIVEHAEEHMLVAKTTPALIAAVESFVRAHHSYEVPEIIAQPLLWASDAYADWVRANVWER